MQAQLGPAFDEFLRAFQQPSPVSVRYNPAKLKSQGADPVPWCASGRYLDSRPSFTRDPLFHAGGYYVQEASSMLLEQAVCQAVDNSIPLNVLDLCAAPGGKSTHLLSLLCHDSLVVSNEVIGSRANALLENLEKWGYPNTIITKSDPAVFRNLEAFFDLVVVDAPCSGEGLFRKDAQAMEEWSPRSVDVCASRQRRIVSDVWGSLRPGGRIIYSTCTYNEKENQQNLQWIKETHGCEFVKLRLDPSWGIAEVNVNGCIGYQCLPHRVRGEGFFISIMRKQGKAEAVAPRAKDRLRYPSSSDQELVSSWVLNPDDFLFFLHGTHLRMLPLRHKASLLILLDRLHVLQAGTGVGEPKKNKIVPNHALAQSICRDRERLPGVCLTEAQALAYLRMEPLDLPNLQAGFGVAEYEGLGLGWVNVLPTRVNNLFPSTRRIRLVD